MAWYELDEWDTLGAAGEAIKAALQKAATQMEHVASNAVHLSKDAAARAQYARAMSQNLDELSNAMLKALDSVDRSRLDAQLVARIETMRTELGKMESFSKIAQEADSAAKLMSGFGRQLGGIISASQLLWTIKDPSASSFEVGRTAIGILGGMLGGAMVGALVASALPGATVLAGATSVMGGLFLARAAEAAWKEYIAPSILNWSANNSPLFRDEVSRTIDRVMGVSSSGVTMTGTRTDGDWSITTYSNGAEIRMSTLSLGDYRPGFEPGYVGVGGEWVGYSVQVTTPNGKGGHTVQYIGQSGTVTKTDTNGDGVFDHVKKETRLADGASVIREDTNGDGVADRNFIVNGGQRYDLSNVRDAAFADSLLSRYRASGLLSGTSYLDLSQVDLPPVLVRTAVRVRG